jgi:cytosine deaminase
MCSGAAVLYRIPRVIIGENQTFTGDEDWMNHRGTDIHVMNDQRCVALMKRLQHEKPDLWAEDIGL